MGIKLWQSTRSRTAGLLSAAGPFVLLLVGCNSPTEVLPDPPSGGTSFAFDYERFVQEIRPAFTRLSCDTGACHGGGIRGTFELSPVESPDDRLDFERTILQTTPLDPVESALLKMPLAEDAGGDPHSFEPFESSSDPDYQRILNWIEAAEAQ